MIKFDPKAKTYGDVLGPAMKITDKSEAQQYLKDYITDIQKHLDAGQENKQGYTAEQIAKNNLGYFAGYYDNETRERVEKLFECSHPIFGKIAEKASPSAEEAFERGRNFAKNHKKNRA